MSPTIFPETARRLVQAPLTAPEAVKALGRSLWLYVLLLSSANNRGFVLQTRGHLARTLAVPEETIETWLSRLVEAGLVRVVSPSPYLVIALRFWSGEASSTNANAQDSSGPAPSRLDQGPVYSHSHAAAIALEQNGDRGAGKGGGLRTELRTMLPEAEAAEIERILQRYPAATLAKTLDRVKRTPAAKIRKSKTALFRYLLAKFSQEIDVDDL